jgi:hypothetical protein
MYEARCRRYGEAGAPKQEYFEFARLKLPMPRVEMKSGS